ncbi:MAG TPA: carboxypeptidase M32 [Anaerolineales bacterium]|jgi:carboxypeptidase Taq|nr:carboxypeptidase M32 [Anaerolineales bacterium]
MEEKLQELKQTMSTLSDLGHALAVMGWDQETYMPPGGLETRGNALATISKMAQEIGTDEKVGKLIEALEPWAADQDPDSDEARMIAVARRNYDQAVKVPPEMVAEQAILSSQANAAWREARQKSDYSIFEPFMEKIVDYSQRFAELFKPYDHPYDVLLDLFEPKMKTEDVKKIFADIRPKQVKLIEAVANADQVDDSVLHKFYPKQAQLAMGEEVVKALGYDFNRGRQDAVTHPFMTNLGYGDARITYRVDENFFNSYLFAIMHEAGHALYEQGIPKSLSRTSLYGAASLAIHESQSRLWENLVGRSMPFLEWYYPKLQERFPEQTKGVSLEAFYQAINKVEPSFIRVEADEATYNLHIMLRLEIEIGLLEGTITPSELPQAWNDRFEQYLGIRPKNDAEGCLQDVHWSFGLFGYFSTYALGNLVSAQLWEKINEDIPNLDDQIRTGKFDELLGWLNKKVHAHGSKFFPQDLVQRITGSTINGDAYIKYLEEKFSGIYGL